MRRAAYLTALVLFGTLAIPVGASAWMPPGDRPARNQMVDEVMSIAGAFWAARSVQTCSPALLDVRLASDLSDGKPWEKAYGRGQLNGCKVWFLKSLVASAQGRRPGNDMAIYLCRTAVIELGHTGGLDDAYGTNGVMDPAATWTRGTPFACRQWAASQRRASQT